VYVNTDVAPGGDGSPGNPYATLTEALIPIRLVGSTSAPWDIRCSGAAADPGFSGIWSLDHSVWEFVTSPTNKVRVFGNNTSGRWDASKYHISVTNRHAIYNQYAAHIELYGLQVELTVTDTLDHDAIRLSTANNDTTNGAGFFIIKNCIARTGPSSINGTVRGFIQSILGAGNGDLYVENGLFIGRGTSTDIGFNTDATPWAQAHVRHSNCTVAKCVFGFEDSSITKNCLATGCAFGFLGTMTGDYNAEDDGNGIPGGGTHNHSATTFTFVDAANGNYHLASTDTGARGLGVTAPDGALFSDDLDGQTRAIPWDIGADQYAVVASAARFPHGSLGGLPALGVGTPVLGG